jgi:hypothetical protein
VKAGLDGPFGNGQRGGDFADGHLFGVFHDNQHPLLLPQAEQGRQQAVSGHAGEQRLLGAGAGGPLELEAEPGVQAALPGLPDPAAAQEVDGPVPGQAVEIGLEAGAMTEGGQVQKKLRENLLFRILNILMRAAPQQGEKQAPQGPGIAAHQDSEGLPVFAVHKTADQDFIRGLLPQPLLQISPPCAPGAVPRTGLMP